MRAVRLGAGPGGTVRKGKPVVIDDVVDRGRFSESSGDTMKWLAELLEREGVELTSVTESELQRGTPVFVEADADVLEVQRLMAKNHIRRLPVVKGGQLVGVVDLVDIAMNADVIEAAGEPSSVGDVEIAVLPPLADERKRDSG